MPYEGKTVQKTDPRKSHRNPQKPIVWSGPSGTFWGLFSWPKPGAEIYQQTLKLNKHSTGRPKNVAVLVKFVQIEEMLSVLQQWLKILICDELLKANLSLAAAFTTDQGAKRG